MIYPGEKYFCSVISSTWPELCCQLFKALEKRRLCPKHSVSEGWVLRHLCAWQYITIAWELTKAKETSGPRHYWCVWPFLLILSSSGKLQALRFEGFGPHGNCHVMLPEEADNCLPVWQRRERWRRKRSVIWSFPAESLDFKKCSLGLKLSSPLSGGSHTTIKQDAEKLDLAAYPFLPSILYPIFILFIIYLSYFYILFILYF